MFNSEVHGLMILNGGIISWINQNHSKIGKVCIVFENLKP